MPAIRQNSVDACPYLTILHRYNYVLFTDCDVYFRRRITLDDFGGWMEGAPGRARKVAQWHLLASETLLQPI